MTMSKIHFKPWVGQDYFDAGLYGLRILVVGESHYGSGDQNPSFTRTVVKKWGQDNRRSFFTVVAKLLLGHGRGVKVRTVQRKQFWEKIAFYNYVQEFVGPRPRMRPTPAMWKRSEKAYHQVLCDLKPDLVVVLGKQLAKYLPAPEAHVTVCKVRHPSGGFKYRDHLQSLKEAVQEASERKCLGPPRCRPAGFDVPATSRQS
jgi:hypothetical protein